MRVKDERAEKRGREKKRGAIYVVWKHYEGISNTMKSLATCIRSGEVRKKYQARWKREGQIECGAELVTKTCWMNSEKKD